MSVALIRPAQGPPAWRAQSPLPGRRSAWAAVSRPAHRAAFAASRAQPPRPTPPPAAARDGTNPRILFAAGGTGGHVYPAIAIADEVRRLDPTAEIEFAGTAERMEWRAVPAAGYKIHPIPAVAARRPLLHPANLALPLRLLHALWRCWGLIGRLRPHVVVGTGGYVALPTCLAAALRGRQVAIQEQNAHAGVANRLLARFAAVVFVAFRAAMSYLEKIGDAYAAADLVVARAGAITCSELLVTGTPSVLIPAASVAEDHQTKNARAMADAGAAEVLPEDKLGPASLLHTVERLLGNRQLLDHMRGKARRAASPNAATDIAEVVLGMARKELQSTRLRMPAPA